MNIAVYCSSSNHITEHYKQSAYQLGEWMAENGHTLIFGGATGGLMSSISEGVSSKKGKIIGVIPDAVIRMNRQSSLCTELVIVESMSERKAKMKAAADIFVVLPGSFGTLDELFDVLASGIVGEHKKETIIVNQNGFYDELFLLTEKMIAEGFIPIVLFEPIIVSNISQCIQVIREISQHT